MVTKWKNMCERICKEKRNRVILLLGMVVFALLLSLGAQTLLASTDFCYRLSMMGTSYEESLVHEEDFYSTLRDLSWNIFGKQEEGLDKELFDIEPYYEYIAFHEDYFYRHETNGSDELRAETSKNIDMVILREHCAIYYVWDGKQWMKNEEEPFELPEDMEELELLQSHTRLAIGYTPEMLQAGEKRLAEWRNDVTGGLILTTIGLFGIILLFGMLVLGVGKKYKKKIYWDGAFSIFGVSVWGICYCWFAWDSCGWEWWDGTVNPIEIILAIISIIGVLFCGYMLGREIAMVVRTDPQQRNLCEKFWVNQCVKRLQLQVKDRVTGAYYYERGLVTCQQMRQKFTFILAGVMLVVAFEGAVLVSGILYFNFAPETDMFAFFLTIFLMFFYGIAGIAIYRWYKQGTKMLFTEYDTLMNQLECLIKGEFDNEALLPETSVLVGESKKLALLGGKMSENVQKQIQAERMKIDLITNVSHDLKTPLTSVISYLDLLSKEELSPVAKDYVEVLQNKSGRLKKMIEDVFELTKASSRNLPLNKEPVNLKKLLLQTLADMQQEIEKAPAKVVENLPEVAAIVYSDGQKLYRILQNLLENALRYAMPETRIYVTLKVEENQAKIMVKNVSSYEMDFTEEEVLGRFFRGDKARSTEGSGLGLAIAKEFTEVCGGTLGLSIDGDVFGVEVALPLQEEKEQE